MTRRDRKRRMNTSRVIANIVKIAPVTVKFTISLWYSKYVSLEWGQMGCHIWSYWKLPIHFSLQKYCRCLSSVVSFYSIRACDLARHQWCRNPWCRPPFLQKTQFLFSHCTLLYHILIPPLVDMNHLFCACCFCYFEFSMIWTESFGIGIDQDLAAAAAAVSTTYRGRSLIVPFWAIANAWLV